MTVLIYAVQETGGLYINRGKFTKEQEGPTQIEMSCSSTRKPHETLIDLGT